jgi:hypothetical protein
VPGAAGRLPGRLSLASVPGIAYLLKRRSPLLLPPEIAVSALFWVFLLIFLAATVVLWAGTLFFQGAIYSEPASHLYWRAPLGGLVVTLFLVFWSYLEYRRPASYGPVFDFTSVEDEQFPKLWGVKNGREILFVPHKTAKGRTEYRNPDNGKLWTRSDPEGIMEAVIVEDKDGGKFRFNAELTPDGKFRLPPGEPARYREQEGRHREMTDQEIGVVHVRHWGRVLANIVLNLLHLAVWVGCLWLVLDFQGWHALGLALIVWLIMTLTIVPPLFKRTDDTAHQQRIATPTTARAVDPPHTIVAIRGLGINSGVAS